MKTAKQLKAWARANRSLAMTVVKAKVFAEMERERVDAYVRPIFLRYGFRDDLFEDGNGEILTDPRRLYLSKEDDRAKEFYAECDRAHREHGFDGPEGHCPALVAEDLQCRAEQLLLASLAAFQGLDDHDFSRSLDLRARALDLALGVCLGKITDDKGRATP